MRVIPGILIALAVGAASGLAATWWTLRGDTPAFGAVTIGPWQAFPRLGAPDADLYARASLARTGEIPLVRGEGLTFRAERDSAGRPLDGGCVYRVGPIAPPARWWTLTVEPAEAGARAGLASSEIVRDATGGATIVTAPRAEPGMWLPTRPGSLRLVLRLYDMSTIAWLDTATADALPDIMAERCG